MSLLLEALKKAEKAKEEAQRRARGEPEQPAPAAAEPPPAARAPRPAVELALQEEAPPPEETRRVTTRAELPDISAPLEIANDDFATKAPPRPREELRLEGAKEAPRRKPAAGAPQADAAPQAAARDTARKVFEAKFKEPNPRLPFLITLGVLGVCAVGIVVYFWYQLRPPYPLVNANPPRQAAEAQVVAAAPPPQAARPASSSPSAAANAIPVPASASRRVTSAMVASWSRFVVTVHFRRKLEEPAPCRS